MDKEEIEQGLRQFTGSTEHYQHWTKAAVYSEGVKYLADKCQCYWLLDDIVLYQKDKRVFNDMKLQEIQFWRLLVNKVDRSAVLECCRDGDDVAFSITYSYTDCPLDKVEIWWQFDTLYLPSEH